MPATARPYRAASSGSALGPRVRESARLGGIAGGARRERAGPGAIGLPMWDCMIWDGGRARFFPASVSGNSAAGPLLRREGRLDRCSHRACACDSFGDYVRERRSPQRDYRLLFLFMHSQQRGPLLFFFRPQPWQSPALRKRLRAAPLVSPRRRCGADRLLSVITASAIA